jgi:hypothetical protein
MERSLAILALSRPPEQEPVKCRTGTSSSPPQIQVHKSNIPNRMGSPSRDPPVVGGLPSPDLQWTRTKDKDNEERRQDPGRVTSSAVFFSSRLTLDPATEIHHVEWAQPRPRLRSRLQRRIRGRLQRRRGLYLLILRALPPCQQHLPVASEKVARKMAPIPQMCSPGRYFLGPSLSLQISSNRITDQSKNHVVSHRFLVPLQRSCSFR